MGLLDFLGQAAGQRRRQWLDETVNQPIADSLSYYLGPTGVDKKLGAVNEVLNPVVGVQEGMTAGGQMMDPNLSGRERAGAALRMATEVAGVTAPAVVPRFGGNITEAVTDVATGIGMTPAQIGLMDAGKNFALDEAGSIPAPKKGSIDLLDDPYDIAADPTKPIDIKPGPVPDENGLIDLSELADEWEPYNVVTPAPPPLTPAELDEVAATKANYNKWVEEQKAAPAVNAETLSQADNTALKKALDKWGSGGDIEDLADAVAAKYPEYTIDDEGFLIAPSGAAAHPHDVLKAKGNVSPDGKGWNPSVLTNPPVTWQQVYDDSYDIVKQQIVSEGDLEGPTSYEDVIEKLKKDPYQFAAVKDQELEYFHGDYLDEQLDQDFTKVSDVDEDELLEMAAEMSFKELDELIDVPRELADGFSIDDLAISHDPNQLVMEGIGEVPEGPNAMGQSIIDQLKGSYGDSYIDADDVLDLDDFTTESTTLKMFDPKDNTEELSLHYNFDEMAEESATNYFDEMDEGSALDMAGIDDPDELFYANAKAQDAEYNGEVNEDDIYAFMESKWGYEHSWGDGLEDEVGDDFDMAAFDAGFSGAPVVKGSRAGTDYKSWNDIDQETLSDLVRQGAAAGDSGGIPSALLEVAQPRVRGNVGLLDRLQAETEELIASRGANLSSAEADEYVNNMFPLYHLTDTRHGQPSRTRRGGYFTGSNPRKIRETNASLGKYEYASPLMSRGKALGYHSLPDKMQTGVQKSLAEAEGTPATVYEAVKKAVVDTTGTNIPSDSGQMDQIVNQIIKNYLVDPASGGRVSPNLPASSKFVFRDPVEMAKELRPGRPLPDGSTYPTYGQFETSSYQQLLEDIGFDGQLVSDENMGWGTKNAGERTAAWIKPEVLRHPQALFDAANRNKRNIFNSSPLAGLLGLGMAQGQPEEDEQALGPRLLGGNI